MMQARSSRTAELILLPRKRFDCPLRFETSLSFWFDFDPVESRGSPRPVESGAMVLAPALARAPVGLSGSEDPGTLRAGPLGLDSLPLDG